MSASPKPFTSDTDLTAPDGAKVTVTLPSFRPPSHEVAADAARPMAWLMAARDGCAGSVRAGAGVGARSGSRRDISGSAGRAARRFGGRASVGDGETRSGASSSDTRSTVDSLRCARRSGSASIEIGGAGEAIAAVKVAAESVVERASFGSGEGVAVGQTGGGGVTAARL